MRYTAEQLDFLRDGYRSMVLADLTEAFNTRFCFDKKPATIKATLKNHKITCGRKPGLPAGVFRLVTIEQAAFLAAEYKRMPMGELAEVFNQKYGENKTPLQLRRFMKNNSMKSGRTGCFEEGGTPWNAGSGGVMKANRGSFSKGKRPDNAKPIGHERVCPRDGFILIKLAEPNPYTGAPTRYKHKHRVVWEAANGEVPAGHVISFSVGSGHAGNQSL